MSSANERSYNLDSQPSAIVGPSSLSENIYKTFPDSASQQSPSSPQKTCSVRGCKRNVIQDSGTKMCEVCRGRHRIYATTKRARRKLEKAAVVDVRRMSEQVDNIVSVSASVAPDNNSDQGVVVSGAEVSGWKSIQTATATAAATSWDDMTTDPQLFSQSVFTSVSASPASVNTQNPMNFMDLHLSSYPPVPYVSSTSSELAGALTLPPSTNIPTVGTGYDNKSGTSYYRPRLPDGTLMQLDSTTPRTSPAGGSRKKKKTRQTPEADKEGEESCDENGNENNEGQASISTPTGDNEACDTATDIVTVPVVDIPTSFCSVKGCKAVIPASYTFKMCPPCRVRYRTYGITKRAKWKAERAAFDRELGDLRAKEDERRKLAGERPLSESPEELHVWEVSILDEKVPLPSEVAIVAGTPFPVPLYAMGVPSTEEGADLGPYPDVASGGGSGNVNTMNLPQNMGMIDPTNAVDMSVSPYPHVNSLLLPVTFQLPARMCTVSHCHKLLPGLHRYKRCEQHRLQNRYHSKLKRFREKVVKAERPTGQEECFEVDKGKEENKWRMKKEKASEKDRERETTTEGGRDAEESFGVLITHTPMKWEEKEKEDEEKKSRKRAFRCTSDGCCNLLSPEIRWRNCETCRAKERVVRRERRVAEQAAAKEVDRLREIVRAVEAKGRVSGLEVEDQQGRMQAEKSGVEADVGVSQMEDGDAEEDPNNATGEEQVDLNDSEGADGDDDMANGESEPDARSDEICGSNTASLPHGLPAQMATVPTATTGTEPNASPVAISSETKGGTYHSIFRTTAATNVDKNDEANPVRAAGDSAGKTKPTILTANLADTDGLTFKEYQRKTASSTAGRLWGQNPEHSVQVLKDLLAPKEKQANTGLVGPSSYHVYQSTLPPARELPVFVPTAPRSAPFVEKAHMEVNERLQAQEQQQTETVGQEESVVASSSGPPMASGSGETEPPSTTSLTTTLAKRKRPSRAAPKPPQPPPQSPMPAYPYPNVPSSQYPYPYYVSTYGMPPYGMPLPQPPASTSASFSTAGLQPSRSPYLPQPYHYSYQQHYGPPPPGYIYASSGYAPAPYNQPQQHQLYSPHQLQPGTYTFPYVYPNEAEYSYVHDPPKEYSFVVPRQRRPKRKRIDLCAIAATASSAPAGTSSTSEAAPAAADGVTSITTGGIPAATGNIGSFGNNTTMSNDPIGSTSTVIPESGAIQSRPCGNKTCSRTIAATVTGTLCGKCRLRLKKLQARAKQRFKLEPRKSILGIMRGGSNGGDKGELATTATVNTDEA